MPAHADLFEKLVSYSPKDRFPPGASSGSQSHVATCHGHCRWWVLCAEEMRLANLTPMGFHHCSIREAIMETEPTVRAFGMAYKESSATALHGLSQVPSGGWWSCPSKSLIVVATVRRSSGRKFLTEHLPEPPMRGLSILSTGLSSQDHHAFRQSWV